MIISGWMAEGAYLRNDIFLDLSPTCPGGYPELIHAVSSLGASVQARSLDRNEERVGILGVR